MITDSQDYWDEKALSPNWREYILPGRTSKSFEQEGYMQSGKFSRIVDPFSIVIDYGCGVGRMTRYLKLWYEKIIGLDISGEYIKKAKKRNRKVKGIEFHTTKQFKEKENIADLVICIMVMQHNSGEKREIIIDDIHRLLKPGGTAIISFPRIESQLYRETGFVHKFTSWEVCEYGKRFNLSEVIKGNLVNYQRKIIPGSHHEYFLKATK